MNDTCTNLSIVPVSFTNSVGTGTERLRHGYDKITHSADTLRTLKYTYERKTHERSNEK